MTYGRQGLLETLIPCNFSVASIGCKCHGLTDDSGPVPIEVDSTPQKPFATLLPWTESTFNPPTYESTERRAVKNSGRELPPAAPARTKVLFAVTLGLGRFLRDYVHGGCIDDHDLVFCFLHSALNDDFAKLLKSV